MADSSDKLAYLYKFVQKNIDGATKNTDFSLDFLEGYVYAMLVIQQEIRAVYGSQKDYDRED